LLIANPLFASGSDIDIDFADLADNMELVGMAIFGARKTTGPFSLM